jgi:tagatose 1,6-diphosphate aldolase
VASSVALERRLGRLFGTEGLVLGLALDHRDSFRAAVERAGLSANDPDLIPDIKVDLVRELAPHATAVMLDAELGARALDAGLLPPIVALVMPLEEQGYEDVEGGAVTTLMAGFGPDIASSRFGADACKLLLPLRADHAPSRERQKLVALEAAAVCRRHGLPLVIEPVVRKLRDESEQSFGDGYPELVIGAAVLAREWGADLLKLPFPALAEDAVARDACAALHLACAGTPWVLLGAGAAPESFELQLRDAVTAGARGFLAGRSVWERAVAVPQPERVEAIRAIAVPVFERFCQVARSARSAGGA